MKKFFRSLLAKYILIILIALSLVQIGYILLGLFVLNVDANSNVSQRPIGIEAIEQKWRAEANGLEEISREGVQQLFANWKREFPEASMFWVDDNGLLTEAMDRQGRTFSKCDPGFAAQFINEHNGKDPFTAIAFLGKEQNHGFVVLEIDLISAYPLLTVLVKYENLVTVGFLIVVILFIVVSLWFFQGIRKRLLKLQNTMLERDVDNLPIPIEGKKKDEIGQLEQAFNQMVSELRESKEREEQEEQIRRELIANLSHDLRTPLTKIRAQTYSVEKENLSPEGRQAVKAIDASVAHIDRLIENLMSYTLLMASKYQYEPQEVDLVRFVRESLATWYPAFEKEKLEVDIELRPFEANKWAVDPIWLGRILDNLFQNVLRHAKEGRYIGVKTESTDDYEGLVIIDRGKGMKNKSNQQGAGIGLSIVDLMVKGMKLDWDLESSEYGTIIKIKKYK